MQTRTTTTHNQKQGHRVISEHSAEIVPRWVLHQTKKGATSRQHQSASRYYLAPSSPNHSMTLCTPDGCPIKPEYPAQTRTTNTQKQQQGHRVISEHSDEIVPRWVLHNTYANQNIHYPKTTARTSSDFGAQRRNCTEMGATSNQNALCTPGGYPIKPDTPSPEHHSHPPPNTVFP